jgi:septal ring factor EnvC (AmiA/AmiB activator)
MDLPVTSIQSALDHAHQLALLTHDAARASLAANHRARVEFATEIENLRLKKIHLNKTREDLKQDRANIEEDQEEIRATQRRQRERERELDRQQIQLNQNRQAFIQEKNLFGRNQSIDTLTVDSLPLSSGHSSTWLYTTRTTTRTQLRT